MRSGTVTGRIFDLVVHTDNHTLSYEDVAKKVGADNSTVRTILHRFKSKGELDFELKDGRINVISHINREDPLIVTGAVTKRELYGQLITGYMSDFESATTFSERLLIGRELRLLIEKI